MKEIKIKGYTFKELNEKAKTTALETHRDILVEHNDWHEPVLEGFKEDLELIGFADIKPAYSGFWSQGDGACFTSNCIALVKVFERIKSTNYFDIPQSWMDAANDGLITATIIKGRESFCYRYEHSNTITANIEYFGNSEQMSNGDLSELDTVLTAYARHLSDTLYLDLETAYDAETADEAVGAELEEREYLFTEEGQHIKFN
jgi:hypothetical protein